MTPKKSEVTGINSLPLFTQINPESIEEDLSLVITENTETINAICAGESVDYENILFALEQVDNKLTKLWSPVSHLNSVMNTEELRLVYTKCLPLLSDYSTEMGQHKGLYQLITVLDEKDLGNNASRSKVISNSLKKFKLSGVDLAERQQREFKKLSSALVKLTSKFSDNVLDATNTWTKEITNKGKLKGLPDSALEMAETLAEQRKVSSDDKNKNKTWLLTLDFPIFNAVMTYAENRELRKEIYTAFTTRASDQGEGDESLDNSKVMEDIIKLRTQKAKILGFNNFAEQSLYKKMANDSEQVILFLTDLLKKSKRQAHQEMKVMKDFASKELNLNDLQAWDVSFVREKLQHHLLGYSEEEIKPWFSVENVLAGLFELVGKLYDCRIALKEGVDVWHEDVRFYKIYDKADNHIASFYLDLYARQNKRGGAWMDSYCGRCLHDGEVQIPVAYLTCNSSSPSVNKPALFTHNEVITLFHEFGHGLHHMLTKVDYLDISGISGVEWDAVELPSQFMENWCWQRESLDLFAKHFETDELIPDDLFDKMLKTRHFNSGLDMLRQLEFALFDIRLHMDSNIETYDQISAILEEVREETSILAPPEFNRFLNSFSHIFAGGYAAGYYSYKWAEVLSADAFSKFEETGLFNKDTSQSFLHEVLEMGGARSANESFKAFRGRDPDIAALLKYSGIHG